ncbi:MAG TPA: nucleotidyltransferase domain-containing protein [Chitinophagales bacterium]|nr:nucleotidyltransferase domain-containing protein [Chitinophagales bacterium]
MDQNGAIEKVKSYTEVLKKYFDINAVFLYGSYASGKQREHSDIDVAVVVNSIDKDFFTYAPLLWRLRMDIDTRIEPLLFEKGKDESGFLAGIEKEGLKIY